MRGEPYESNTKDMDPAKTADMIKRHRDVIVGIKTAHFSGTGWTAIDRAREAGPARRSSHYGRRQNFHQYRPYHA